MDPRAEPAQKAVPTDFEAIALPFMRALHGTALHLTRRPEDARDLVQETYLRAYRTFDGFTPGTNARAWLFTILYSVFFNGYRRRQREPAQVPWHEVEERFARTAAMDAEQTQLASPLAAAVESALARLPEDFRLAVLLVDLNDLSYEEAAAALGCPLGTVRSRLFRARKLLYIHLREHARGLGYPTGG